MAKKGLCSPEEEPQLPVHWWKGCQDQPGPSCLGTGWEKKHHLVLEDFSWFESFKSASPPPQRSWMSDSCCLILNVTFWVPGSCLADPFAVSPCLCCQESRRVSTLRCSQHCQLLPSPLVPSQRICWLCKWGIGQISLSRGVHSAVFHQGLSFVWIVQVKFFSQLFRLWYFRIDTSDRRKY